MINVKVVVNVNTRFGYKEHRKWRSYMKVVSFISIGEFYKILHGNAFNAQTPPTLDVMKTSLIYCSDAYHDATHVLP